MSVHLVRNQTYNLTTGEVTEDVPQKPRKSASDARTTTARYFLAKNDPRGFALAVRNAASA